MGLDLWTPVSRLIYFGQRSAGLLSIVKNTSFLLQASFNLDNKALHVHPQVAFFPLHNIESQHLHFSNS